MSLKQRLGNWGEFPKKYHVKRNSGLKSPKRQNTFTCHVILRCRITTTQNVWRQLATTTQKPWSRFTRLGRLANQKNVKSVLWFIHVVKVPFIVLKRLWTTISHFLFIAQKQMRLLRTVIAVNECVPRGQGQSDGQYYQKCTSAKRDHNIYINMT